MTERTEPLTPTVLFVGDKRSNWTNPPIYRLTARYATPTTVACDPVPGAKDVTLKPMAGRKVILKQQHHVYPVRDDATWARITAQHAALQAALDEFAAGLRTLGSYARRLQEAGGMKTAPNPLCTTVILAPDPETDRETWYTSALVPRVERKAIARHTPKMLATQPDAASYVFSQGSTFVCPDDAAWEDIQSLHAAAQAQADAWERLLRSELLVYVMAKASERAARSRPKDRPPPASAFPGAPIVLPRTRDLHATDMDDELLGMLQDEGYTWSHADQTPDGRWHHVVRHHVTHGGRYRRERLAARFCLPAGSPAPLAIAEPAAIAGVVMMSADEARAAATRIQTAIGNLRQLIDDFDHREGWAALGYVSFRAWAIAEVDDASLRHIYRLRDAADVDRSLGVTIGHTPESHARVLKPISPADRPAVLARADALAGNQPRQAKHIERAVAEQQAPASAAKKPEIMPDIIPVSVPRMPDRATLEGAAREGRVLDAAEAWVLLCQIDPMLAQQVKEATYIVVGATWVMGALVWTLTISEHGVTRPLTKTTDGLRALVNAAAPAGIASDLHAALTAAGWAWDGTWYRQDGRVVGPDSPHHILWSIANPDGSPHPPDPLPVIPALDMDRIAALAVRDIRYLSSRTTVDGRELHTIRGAFGERETSLAGIDHLIAAVSPVETIDDAPAESWETRAITALDLLMKFDIDPRYPGRLPGTLDLAIELVAALAIGIGLAESDLVGKLTAALARATEVAHA